jgi:hypothetical protein
MTFNDDRLDDAARALGGRLPELDARVDDAVMAAVRRRRAPARRRAGWRWFLEPRTVQVRPVWAAAGLAAAAAVAIWVGRPTDDARRTIAASARTAVDTVYVHFALTSPTAHNVSVAGSFNGWDAAALSLRQDANGVWEATVPLPVGEHRYQFVVDGQRWVPDPAAQSQMDDGFGGTNSVIVVGPKGVVRS